MFWLINRRTIPLCRAAHACVAGLLLFAMMGCSADPFELSASAEGSSQADEVSLVGCTQAHNDSTMREGVDRWQKINERCVVVTERVPLWHPACGEPGRLVVIERLSHALLVSLVRGLADGSLMQRYALSAGDVANGMRFVAQNIGNPGTADLVMVFAKGRMNQANEISTVGFKWLEFSDPNGVGWAQGKTSLLLEPVCPEDARSDFASWLVSEVQTWLPELCAQVTAP